VLTPKAYLAPRLTGTAATDPSGAGLLDVAADVWSQPLLDAIGLDLAALRGSAPLAADAARRRGLRAGTPSSPVPPTTPARRSRVA
jgi:sugar (pentulose or hexulose) kinase